MARPREFDEQQALMVAMQVFWEKGYEATSIGDLTDRMGIQRPSLYAAFGGKDQLFQAALTKYAQLSLDFVRRKLLSASGAKEAVRLYLHGITDSADGRRPELGCLCVNTIVELAPHDSSLAAFTRDYQRQLSDLLRQTIERGMQSGELSRDRNAVALANALTIAAIGLSVTMKSGIDRAAADNAIAEMVHLLG